MTPTAEFWAALYAAVLVAVCIRVSVPPQGRRLAILKSAALAFGVTFAVAYFVTHPAPGNPLSHCLTGEPDF